MRSAFVILALVAICLSSDVDWLGKIIDRKAPCPYANAHRGDGGLAECDKNCNDVILEKQGKHDNRPCALVGIINGCFCDEGFVRKSLEDESCVAIGECR